MRVGTFAETLFERFALWMNVVPEPLLDSQIGATLARVLMASVRFGFVETLSGGPKSAKAVAASCGTDASATEKLLNALVASGYLRFGTDGYSLTPKSRKWLLASSPSSLADKLIFQYDEWKMLGRLDDFVESGDPVHFHAGDGGDAEEVWGRYQRGMRSLSALSADEVATSFPMPDAAKDLLDIGGSHGFYSVCLCRNHDRLRATVMDLPDAIENAAPILAKENMGDRVGYRAGDALESDLGDSAWDAIFMSQLIHHFTDAQNRELMTRIARGLRPGGVCVILDSIRPAVPGYGGQIAALLDVYFALLSESGTWPLEAIHDWQKSAGLTPLDTRWIKTLPGAALVCAEKPR